MHFFLAGAIIFTLGPFLASYFIFNLISHLIGQKSHALFLIADIILSSAIALLFINYFHVAIFYTASLHDSVPLPLIIGHFIVWLICAGIIYITKIFTKETLYIRKVLMHCMITMVFIQLFLFSFGYLKMQFTISRYFPNCNIGNSPQCISSEAIKKSDYTMCDKLFYGLDILNCNRSVTDGIFNKAMKQSNPALCEKILDHGGEIGLCKYAVENNIK